MKRLLYRMVLHHKIHGAELPGSVEIRPYHAPRHHETIPSMYARSFGEPPWPADWDQFAEFDPQGVFVAEDVKIGEVIGFVVCFRRRDFGYISVVAVVPEHHRQGIASALMSTATAYLHELDLQTIKIDAFVDSTPAVNLYRKLGFQVESTFEDAEDG